MKIYERQDEPHWVEVRTCEVCHEEFALEDMDEVDIDVFICKKCQKEGGDNEGRDSHI